MFSKVIHRVPTLTSPLFPQPVISFENNSGAVWMSSAWFWCISNLLLEWCAAFLFSPHFLSSPLTLSPFSGRHMPEQYSQWLLSRDPIHISQASSASSEDQKVSSASWAQLERIFQESSRKKTKQNKTNLCFDLEMTSSSPVRNFAA